MSTVVLTRFFDLKTSNPALVAEQSYSKGGSGADRYAAFDQFGDVIDHLMSNERSSRPDIKPGQKS